MEIVPFNLEHLRELALQPMQAWMGDRLTPEYGKSIQVAGPCFTAVHNGAVLGCAGVVRMWAGRDQAWALLGGECGRHFVGIVRGMARFLDAHPTHRVEAVVAHDFAQAHRMIQMLGFEHEGLMRGYMADGRDADLYARIKHG